MALAAFFIGTFIVGLVGSSAVGGYDAYTSQNQIQCSTQSYENQVDSYIASAQALIDAETLEDEQLIQDYNNEVSQYIALTNQIKVIKGNYDQTAYNMQLIFAIAIIIMIVLLLLKRLNLLTLNPFKKE